MIYLVFWRAHHLRESMTDTQKLLMETHSLLTAVNGRIMQVSDRKAAVAMGAATKSVIGASVASTVIGAVGTFGSASTGTAIVTLAGAAKANATLFWFGSLVGGGVAAGTVVVGAGALAAGIYGSINIKKAILGHSRREVLNEVEQKIVVAVHALASAISETVKSGRSVPDKELALFSHFGVVPLIDALQSALDEDVFAQLKTYNRARLRGHLHNLRHLTSRLEKP